MSEMRNDSTTYAERSRPICMRSNLIGKSVLVRELIKLSGRIRHKTNMVIDVRPLFAIHIDIVLLISLALSQRPVVRVAHADQLYRYIVTVVLPCPVTIVWCDVGRSACMYQ